MPTGASVVPPVPPAPPVGALSTGESEGEAAALQEAAGTPGSRRSRRAKVAPPSSATPEPIDDPPPSFALRHPGYTLLAGSLAMAGALFLVMLATEGLDRHAVAHSAQLAAVSAAAGACLFASRRTYGTASRAWLLFTLACAGWATSQVAHLVRVVEPEAGRNAGGLFDLGYVLFLPFAAAGLLVMSAGGLRPAAFARRLADGLIIAGSLLTTVWGVTATGVSEPGTPSGAVALLHAFGCLMVASLLLLIAFRYRLRQASLGLLLAALAILVLTDTGFLVRQLMEERPGLGFWSVGWVLAFLLLGSAAVTAEGTELSPQDARRSLTPLLLPYLFLLLALSCLVTRRFLGEPPRAGEAAMSLILVMVVLVRQLLTLTETHSLLKALADREQEMRHQALHDALTGLANRSLFTNRVEHAVAMHARNGQGVVVMFCDLDDFKHVNDSFGHAAGDALLVTVANRMRRVVRASDTVARLGGDEFAFLLEQPEEDPAKIAERILAAIVEPVRLDDEWIFPNGSIGTAVLPATEQMPVNVPKARRLLADADAAMYAAKAAGKGRHAVAVQGQVRLAPYAGLPFDPLSASVTETVSIDEISSVAGRNAGASTSTATPVPPSSDRAD